MWEVTLRDDQRRGSPAPTARAEAPEDWRDVPPLEPAACSLALRLGAALGSPGQASSPSRGDRASGGWAPCALGKEALAERARGPVLTGTFGGLARALRFQANGLSSEPG